VIWHHVLKAQSTEPAVSQIEMNLFAQPALRANAEAVTHDQHPHHQFRIDRRPTGVTVERCEVATQLAEVEEPINPRSG
jgi:hypothetical protein